MNNRSTKTGTAGAIVNSVGALPAVADDPDRLWSFAEGCTFLGIGRRLGWELVNRKELPHLRVGRLIRFRRSALLAWVESREKGGPRR